MDDGAICYQRFKDGDKSGLEELVKLYNDSLILFLNSYVNNPAIAEDLAAETFFELLTKKSHYINKYSFKTWLFKIGKNNAIDYIRKQAKRSHVSIHDYEIECKLEDPGCLEEIIVKNEQTYLIHQAMQNINPDYREVLHLLYFEEMSYDEAAVVLKKSNKQIKNLAYRARLALKSVFGKEGLDYENLY
jgi:RNA polymerase sigma factor (sigma-70 family)